jgi:FixJ family two-component response regulator
MGSHSVLVAILDDEEPVRTALARLLRSADFQTETFGSGQEFLDSLNSHLPDCLVLDLHLSGLTGFDIVQQIVGRKLPIPIIMITGHDMPGLKERALSVGASAYLLKPLDDTTLIEAIASYMQKDTVSN